MFWGCKNVENGAKLVGYEPTPVTWSNIIDIIGGPLKKKTLAVKVHQKVK